VLIYLLYLFSALTGGDRLYRKPALLSARLEEGLALE